MAFMDQLPTLAGVIIGAVGSYTASILTERTRWRRERAERWGQQRFQTYAGYANTLKAQLRISLRIGAARGFDHVVDPLDPDEGLQRLAEAESLRAAEWESMLLVGDAATVAAARTWHEAVWAVEMYARGLKDDPTGWENALKRTSQARDAFYTHARWDLGIEGPPPPSGNWPRTWEPTDEPA